jgi:hypothetical protein
MFSVITNVYNKKIKGPTLMELFTDTGKLNIYIYYTGRFIILSVIPNIYNKKTKGPTLMELFTDTRKLKKFFF